MQKGNVARTRMQIACGQQLRLDSTAGVGSRVAPLGILHSSLEHRTGQITSTKRTVELFGMPLRDKFLDKLHLRRLSSIVVASVPFAIVPLNDPTA